jgi:protein arginine kinase
MNKNNPPSSVLMLKKPWENNKNSIWLGTTATLQRNIERFKFPNKLDSERKKQIIQLVGKEHLALSSLKQPILFKAEDLTPIEKEYLSEHFLTMQTFHQTSTGEGFIIDATGEFLTIFNMSDHVVFHKIDVTGDIEKNWNDLVKIETGLGKDLRYSFSPKFGFLTSDPMNCGTALTVTVYLQLPVLIHTGKIDEILDKSVDEGINIMGIQGNPTEIIGDIICVQNNFTLGVTEENIISSVRSYASKLVSEENSGRNSLKQKEDTVMMDKVSRAYGILMHSYQIEAVEALNALSLLKLGNELGWVSGISPAEFNLLLFHCRRAHLVSQFSEKINQQQIPHKRAEFIHKTLKKVQLLIE